MSVVECANACHYKYFLSTINYVINMNNFHYGMNLGGNFKNPGRLRHTLIEAAKYKKYLLRAFDIWL